MTSPGTVREFAHRVVTQATRAKVGGEHDADRMCTLPGGALASVEDVHETPLLGQSRDPARQSRFAETGGSAEQHRGGLAGQPRLESPPKSVTFSAPSYHGDFSQPEQAQA